MNNIFSRIRVMIVAFAVAVIASAQAALEPVAISLAAGEMPNTEVYTNLSLNVRMARLEKMNFSLEFLGSSSNSLTIAVGTDIDGNGDLSLEEADITFGYDCGEWISAATEDGTVVFEDAPQCGRVTRTYSISRRNFKPEWNMAKFVRRGNGGMDERILKDEDHLKFVISIAMR